MGSIPLGSCGVPPAARGDRHPSKVLHSRDHTLGARHRHLGLAPPLATFAVRAVAAAKSAGRMLGVRAFPTAFNLSHLTPISATICL